jgi:hypothetical protein
MNACLGSQSSFAIARRLHRHQHTPKLSKVILGVKFIDGIEAGRQAPQAAAWPRQSPRFGDSYLDAAPEMVVGDFRS